MHQNRTLRFLVKIEHEGAVTANVVISCWDRVTGIWKSVPKIKQKIAICIAYSYSYCNAQTCMHCLPSLSIHCQSLGFYLFDKFSSKWSLTEKKHAITHVLKHYRQFVQSDWFLAVFKSRLAALRIDPFKRRVLFSYWKITALYFMVKVFTYFWKCWRMIIKVLFLKRDGLYGPI